MNEGLHILPNATGRLPSLKPMLLALDQFLAYTHGSHMGVWRETYPQHFPGTWPVGSFHMAKRIFGETAASFRTIPHHP